MTDYSRIHFTEVGPAMKSFPFHTLCLLFACSKQPTEQIATKVEGEGEVEGKVKYNLPGIWAEATLIENFTQASCNEDMEQVMENAPKASTKIVNGELILSYPNAHFRCDQPVHDVAAVALSCAAARGGRLHSDRRGASSRQSCSVGLA